MGTSVSEEDIASFFRAEDGCNMFLRNFDTHLKIQTQNTIMDILTVVEISDVIVFVTFKFGFIGI
jgi:hypothetical protein